MEKVKACGFLIYRTEPQRSILLMKHPRRWDLPKGHVDDGETNLQCALRELHEETGITEDDLRIEDGFKYKDRYIFETKKGKKKNKTLIVYLAELINDVEIVPTEHDDYKWFDWDPPHAIQEMAIDPLLEYVDQWWQEKSVVSPATARSNTEA